jgi:hypothetical protein
VPEAFADERPWAACAYEKDMAVLSEISLSEFCAWFGARVGGSKESS